MKKSDDIGTRRESAGPPNGPNMDRLDREAIKQEIRELDSLRMDGQLGDIVYHRINELLDLLDSAD